MKKLFLTVASLAILSSTAAFAHESSPCDSIDSAPEVAAVPAVSSVENQWYVKISGGATSLRHLKRYNPAFGFGADYDIDSYKRKTKVGGVAELAIGYYIMENLRADLAISHVFNNARSKATIKGDDTVLRFNNTVTLNDYTADLEFKPNITNLLANAYFDFADVGVLKFFVGAGIGASSIKDKVHYTLKADNAAINNTTVPFDMKKSYSSKRRYHVAYQVSLGASAEVAPGVKAELTYKWADYGKTKKIDDGTTKIAARHYRAHNVLLGFRFDI